MKINDTKIGIVVGQSLNLLNQHDHGFVNKIINNEAAAKAKVNALALQILKLGITTDLMIDADAELAEKKQ